MNNSVRLALLPVVTAGFFAIHSAVAADWNKVFTHPKSAPPMMLQAIYRDEAGQSHQLTLERLDTQKPQKSQWLHRISDHQVELFALRSDDSEMQLRLFDRQQKKVIDAKRTALYQVGIFEEWDKLASNLTKPKEPFQLQRIKTPASTLIACQWAEITLLTHEHPTYQICWSPQWDTVISLRKQQENGQWQTLFDATAITPLLANVKAHWPTVPADYQYANMDEDLRAD